MIQAAPGIRTRKSGAATATPHMKEPRLVLRDARVDLLAPGGDSALDVVDVLEARVLQELDGPRAAASGLAVDGEGVALVELVDVLPVVHPLLELGDGYLRYPVRRLGGLSLRDAAELLVVDKLGDGRVLAADRAVRVLAERHLAETHAEGIVEQQTPDEGLAYTEDELDGLRGLDGPDGTGKYP